MDKKLKIIIVIITLIVGIIGYSQVMPLIPQKPIKDFDPIQIGEAKSTQDNNMLLSYLYNISKEIHPTGSEENYRVRDYITNCLEQMNIEYNVETTTMDKKYLEEKKQIAYKNFIENIDEVEQTAKNNNMDVETFIKVSIGYESIDKYTNKTLSNIIVKMNSQNNSNAKNIMFVAHYDSVDESYGAGDNGMSVAGLLETIRCLKDKDFNNNIYVMFTDGEEVGYWGAYDFINKNNLDIDLIINFDNSGNSGNLMLYHYSDDSLAKQYFKSVSNESSYSFVNELLYNPNSKYYQGDLSDAFAFSDKGYNTLDFALAGTPFYYHTENDNFYNIEISSLNNLTNSMIKMMSYYGDNELQPVTNEEFINFHLLNGIELSISQNAYVVMATIFIVTSCIYIVKLFDKKERKVKRMLAIILALAGIITLWLFKNFSLLFTVPCIILLITDLIKSERIKNISRIVLFECYFFVVIQLLILLVQYIIWGIGNGYL